MSAAWARLRWVGVVGGGELDLGGDFGPAAVAIDATVGAHGAEDRVAGEGYFVDGFDEGVEGGVQTFAALEEQASGAGVAIDGAVVVEFVILRELPGGAPVNEFLLDGFAIGVVAGDAAATVSFEEERLQLLLQPALTVDSIGFPLRFPSAGFRAGGFRGRFRGHGGLSFFGFAAAGRGRGVVRREIVRFSSDGWRRPTFVQSPPWRLFERRQSYIDGRLKMNGGCLVRSNWGTT